MSPFLVEQESLVGAAVVLGPDVELALKEANRNLNLQIHLGTWLRQLVRWYYVVEGVGSLVHSAVQQLVDAKLLYVASDLVGSSAQEVIGLKRRRNQQKANTDPHCENKHHLNHSAPHGRREEAVLVGDVEVLQPVFLEGGREVLRLLFDQVLTGVKVLGDEVEKLPRGGAGGQVVGLDGELDVQDLSVGAQHVPRHVHLHEHQLVVDDLRGHGGR